MNRGAAMIAALVAGAAAACAQGPGDWETAKTEAAAAVDSGNCARAWNLVWPWARGGHIESRAILAGGVVAAGLVPPGGSGDAVSQYRHAVILGAHGAAGGDAKAMETLRALVQPDLVSRMGGRALLQCLDAGRPPRGCVAAAVDAGFVPDFQSYAREIDAAGEGREAHCAAPSETESLPQPAAD